MCEYMDYLGPTADKVRTGGMILLRETEAFTENNHSDHHTAQNDCHD